MAKNFKKFSGRGDRIRTCDIYVPNVALYQSELHPGEGIEGAVVYGVGRRAGKQKQ